MRTLFLRLSIVVFCAAGVSADDIYFQSGAVEHDVKVVEQTPEKIVFIGRNLRRTTWPGSMVLRVEKGRSTIDDYQDKAAAAKDPASLVALAEWAKEKGFTKDVVKGLYEKALALDPKCAKANEALGKVSYEGAWMTPEEKAKKIAEEDAARMRAKGLVRYKDGWVTPEVKANLEKGLVLHDGKWMTPDQVKEAEGFVKLDGRWVRKEDVAALKLLDPVRKATHLGKAVQLEQTAHYVVVGNLPPADLKKVAGTMEKLYAQWTRLWPAGKGAGPLGAKQQVYVFRKAPGYQSFVRYRFTEEKKTQGWTPAYEKQEKVRLRMRLRETSFWEVQPVPLSAHCQSPDSVEGLCAHCVHYGANILATCQGRLRFPTWWLDEGLAYYLEKKISGSIQTYNSDVGSKSGYADSSSTLEGKTDPWIDATQWETLLADLARAGRDPKLNRMKGKNLYDPSNQLTRQDLAKAWSVVTYLMLEDPKKFAAFFSEAKSGKGSDVEREAAAVIKYYGGYGKIEAGWRAYALNGFRLH